MISPRTRNLRTHSPRSLEIREMLVCVFFLSYRFCIYTAAAASPPASVWSVSSNVSTSHIEFLRGQKEDESGSSERFLWLRVQRRGQTNRKEMPSTFFFFFFNNQGGSSGAKTKQGNKENMPGTLCSYTLNYERLVKYVRLDAGILKTRGLSDSRLLSPQVRKVRRQDR